MTYALQIRRLRESRGMTQRQMADRLGLSPAAVAHWELGRKKPTTDNLLAMAELFGCSTDAILGREPPDSEAG